MMRSSIICLFIILLVCFQSEVYAQSTSRADSSKVFTSETFVKNPSNINNLRQLPGYTRDINLLPANLYLRTIGFFCKKEIEMDKATRVPVRFRLGSVSYTDKMENKNNYRAAEIKNFK